MSVRISSRSCASARSTTIPNYRVPVGPCRPREHRTRFDLLLIPHFLGEAIVVDTTVISGPDGSTLRPYQRPPTVSICVLEEPVGRADVEDIRRQGRLQKFNEFYSEFVAR